MKKSKWNFCCTDLCHIIDCDDELCYIVNCNDELCCIEDCNDELCCIVVCNDELGVKAGGKVTDYQLTSSSVYQNNHQTFGPQRGRLYITDEDAADYWAPAIADKNPHIQVCARCEQSVY